MRNIIQGDIWGEGWHSVIGRCSIPGLVRLYAILTIRIYSCKYNEFSCRNGKNSGYGKFQSKQEQTYVTDDDDDDDDDDDVVIGSSASFSRYREQNDNDWKRQQKSSSSSKRMSTSRDPTIYRDPEKQGRGEWYQNKNKSRDNNRASMSQYLEENEREDAERRRKVDEVRRNSRPHQQGTLREYVFIYFIKGAKFCQVLIICTNIKRQINYFG